MRLDEQPAACVVQPVAWFAVTDQVYWHLLYGALGTEATTTFRGYGGKWVMIQSKDVMKKWPICILLSEDYTSIKRTLVTLTSQIPVLFKKTDPWVLNESCFLKVSTWCLQNSVEPHVQSLSTKFHKDNGPAVRWHWPGPLGATSTQVGIFANLAMKATNLMAKKGTKVETTTVKVTRMKLSDVLPKHEEFNALVKLVEEKATKLTGQAMEVVLKDPAYGYPPHVLVASVDDQCPHVDAVARGVYTFIYSIVGGRGTRFYGEIPKYLDTLMTGSKLSFLAEVTLISFM
jgi:hypothetical protein